MRKNFLEMMFYDQFVTQRPVTTADLTGKTVIVTGANTGLGLEACIHFARMKPARLIMASRSEQRGAKALQRLVTETGYLSAEVWPLDLGDFASVKAFADRFSKLDDTRLDILVENAGINTTKYVQTKDGWESILQVNHLSCAYHTLRLLPFLLRTAEKYSVVSRIVILTSQLHYLTRRIDKQTLTSPNLLERLSSKEYSTNVMLDRYNFSKLINILFVRALAARLTPTKAIVDAVSPGLCQSELTRSMHWIMRIVFSFVRMIFAHTAEEGSRHTVFGAVGGGEDLHGKYISNSAVAEESDYLLSDEGMELQERLWRETVQVLEEFDPEVKTAIDLLH